jgi:hypothetical protein
MTLSVEEKKTLIDLRVKEYEAKIFSLEMDGKALLAVEDLDGAAATGVRIEALRKAIEAVRGMKEE